MKTVKNLSIILALALSAAGAGCAAQSPNGDDDDQGSGSGSDDAPKQLDGAGKYQVQSNFDIATNMPGSVGAATNAIINMTDGPADPTEWILDQIIAKMSSGTLKSALQTAKPFVAGYLNDRLLQIAPDFVTTMRQAGNDFGQMARNFGLNEELEIAGSTGAYTGTVRAVGVHFKVDTVETDFNFADFQMAAVEAPGVAIGLDITGKLDVGEHKLPVSYGKVLRIGLDKMIIPMLDPTATDLNSLLTHLVSCPAVGQAINDALVSQFGFGGGASFWQSACVGGLQFGSAAVYGKITSIDASALEFGLTGIAKGLDTNNDSKMDKIQTGAWTGTLTYGGAPAPLSTATFFGQRM